MSPANSLSFLNNIIHVIPIPVNSFSVYILKIETIYHGILAIEIHGRNSIYSLYLHHIDEPVI